MIRKDIIRMARKAGWPKEMRDELPNTGSMNFEMFAALVAEREREECAKVCDELANSKWAEYKGRTEPIDRSKLYDKHTEGVSDGAEECAAAIRARNKP